MPSPIEAMTTAALSTALDAASRRQALVAANIANAGTQGYQPLRLSFEARLDEVRAGLRDGGWLDPASLEVLRGLGEGEAEVRAGTDPVRLDAEMADLVRNAVEFQALVQGVSRHLSLLALAAADGRK